MCKVENNPENNMYHICNNDLEGNQAVKELNKIFGYSEIEIDKERISNVNMERMKNFDLDSLNKDTEMMMA